MWVLMMNCKLCRIFLLCVCVFLLFQGGHLFAGTTIIFDDTAGDATDINTSEAEEAFQELSDINGPIIANSFALSNILGYPIGKSSIGIFEAGVAVGAGLTNTVYYSDEEDAKEGSLPGVTANPVIHAGITLPGGFDVIGKLFYLKNNRYIPDLESSLASLTDYNFLSVGGKLRWNYIEDATVIPFLLSFGGLTFSIGADAMIGNIDISGNYKTELEPVTYTVGGSDYTVTSEFDGDYSSSIKWKMMSITAQAVTYIDIMYLFSFYTGFGLTGNLGFFSTEFDGTGIVSSDDPSLPGAPRTLGGITFESSNNYRPDYFLPTWIFGLELNLTVLKITGETMVNLRNGEDVTLQAGVRIQIKHTFPI